MHDLFRSAGALRPAYAAVDWAATPLGPPEEWSPALVNAVDLALNTGFPITLLWGPEAVLVYNESYVDILAEKHPWALGRPVLEVFSEARELVDGMHRYVMERDEAVYVEDELVPLVRNGHLSEEYFTFAYSPVHGCEGRVEGVIDIVATTTAQVIAGRRLRLLIRLGTALTEADTAPDVLERALEVLDEDTQDVVASGFVEGAATEETLVDGDDGEPVLLIPLQGRGVACGTALRVTLSMLLAADDEAYREFLRLVVRTIDQALDRVQAISSERSFSEALQRSLLTQPVSTPRIDVAVRYQPASEGGRIGGDWYDSFRLPDGRLALVAQPDGRTPATRRRSWSTPAVGRRW
ncbi:PAS domain-containing protein [Nocardioides pyridinolyticus]